MSEADLTDKPAPAGKPEQKTTRPAWIDMERDVRRYLSQIEDAKPGRDSGRRASEAIGRRIQKVDELMVSADPVTKAHLTQERIELHAERVRLGNGEGTDRSRLERSFIRSVKPYSQRTGLSYAAWRQLGVDADVLERAGLVKSARVAKDGGPDKAGPGSATAKATKVGRTSTSARKRTAPKGDPEVPAADPEVPAAKAPKGDPDVPAAKAPKATKGDDGAQARRAPATTERGPVPPSSPPVEPPAEVRVPAAEAPRRPAEPPAEAAPPAAEAPSPAEALWTEPPPPAEGPPRRRLRAQPPPAPEPGSTEGPDAEDDEPKADEPPHPPWSIRLRR